jgi:predicted transcriptional regulator of viral defense system
MHTINGMITQKEKVLKLLHQSTMIHSRELSKVGIDTKTLTRMITEGKIHRIARGLYTSVDYIPGTYHSLIEANKLVGNGVICLLSALSFYEIGTQNPSEVWIAIQRKARMPQIEDYPIRVSRFSGQAFSEGVERITIDNVKIEIFNIPKTIADCFKYRNKIGLEVAVEALKDVLRNKRATVDELLHYAEICRVRNVITPYMESLV